MKGRNGMVEKSISSGGFKLLQSKPQRSLMLNVVDAVFEPQTASLAVWSYPFIQCVFE